MRRLIVTSSYIVLFTLLLPYCSRVNNKATEKPDESRFTPVTLTQDLDEPMVFEVMKNGDVIIAERKGTIKMYIAKLDTTIEVAQVPINTKYTSAQGVVREAEEGLIGFTIDPDYEKNNWVYIYYAHPSQKKHVLSRWVFKDRQFIPSSEVIVLEVPTQREVCCHTGGGMTWDKHKNLYLTIGNNTGNNISAQTDERPGRSSWDDQGHAWNTNDLRGKIIRIHPEENGTYSIPDGNLFAAGTEKTRPEIYAMGLRNPWRVSVDNETGYIYWGEVGPDANEDSRLGPKGYDELNQARGPGNFGWPFFVGPNAPFPYFDYALDSVLLPKDPQKPTNLSVNNTGLTLLPPVEKPFIYYPYAISEKFPLVGSGSRSATGGPVFRKSDFSSDAVRLFPDYYEGKWLATDLSRGWIMAISTKTNGDFDRMERFLATYNPIEPIDIKFGPQGDLYVLEYGSTWFAKSNNSRLVRIVYNAGNRVPLAEATVDKSGGKIPLEIKFSAEGSRDLDGDALDYRWRIADKAGNVIKELHEANPKFIFNQEGVYTATLTVADPDGATNSQSVNILAGNTPPNIAFNITGNNSFYFSGKPVAYTVSVSDEEDGSLANGKISPKDVSISIQYVSAGLDMAEAIQGQRSIETSTSHNIAQALMKQGNCGNCHNPDQKSVGPSLMQISEKYSTNPSEWDRLSKKVRQGGTGVWGEVYMPANPAVTENDVKIILQYIMGLTSKHNHTLPPKGVFTPVIPGGDKGNGLYILQAGYVDKGKDAIPFQRSEILKKLRSPNFSANELTSFQNVEYAVDGRQGALIKPRNNGYIKLPDIDMTGIRAVKLGAYATTKEDNSGATVELRADSATGKLLGEITINVYIPQQTQMLTMEQALQDAGGNVEEANRIYKAALEKARNSWMGPTEALLTLQTPIKGITDIYIVFKNKSAKENQPMLTLKSLTFTE